MTARPIQEIKPLDRWRVCHACGTPRTPLDPPRKGYSESVHIIVREHKAIDTTDIETSPQLIADFRFWRNGGPEDHLCNDCIRLAARLLIKRLEELAS